MKFQTTRNNLLDTALFVNKMINPKISSPILNGMMIDVGKELTLYSTDLETSIKSTVPVVVLSLIHIFPLRKNGLSFDIQIFWKNQ